MLTSNNTRELSEALKRRCLYLFVDYPSQEAELNIVKMRVPELDDKLARQAVDVVQAMRRFDLKKNPSVSETIDWAKALVTLNADSIDQKTLETTLTVLLKHESDVQKARRQIMRGQRRRSLRKPRPASLRLELRRRQLLVSAADKSSLLLYTGAFISIWHLETGMSLSNGSPDHSRALAKRIFRAPIYLYQLGWGPALLGWVPLLILTTKGASSGQPPPCCDRIPASWQQVLCRLRLGRGYGLVSQYPSCRQAACDDSAWRAYHWTRGRAASGGRGRSPARALHVQPQLLDL